MRYSLHSIRADYIIITFSDILVAWHCPNHFFFFFFVQTVLDRDKKSNRIKLVRLYAFFFFVRVFTRKSEFLNSRHLIFKQHSAGKKKIIILIANTFEFQIVLFYLEKSDYVIKLFILQWFSIHFSRHFFFLYKRRRD